MTTCLFFLFLSIWSLMLVKFTQNLRKTSTKTNAFKSYREKWPNLKKKFFKFVPYRNCFDKRVRDRFSAIRTAVKSYGPSARTSVDPILPSLIFNDKIFSSSTSEAEIFTKQFVESHPLIIKNYLFIPKIPIDSDKMSEIIFKIEEIEKKLLQLNNKSSGLDSITAIVLNKCYSEQVPILRCLSNSHNNFPNQLENCSSTARLKKVVKNYTHQLLTTSLVSILSSSYFAENAPLLT